MKIRWVEREVDTGEFLPTPATEMVLQKLIEVIEYVEGGPYKRTHKWVDVPTETEDE